MDWYRLFHEKGNVLTGEQLADYTERAHLAGASWVQS
jgi:hypothetical protein